MNAHRDPYISTCPVSVQRQTCSGVAPTPLGPARADKPERHKTRIVCTRIVCAPPDRTPRGRGAVSWHTASRAPSYLSCHPQPPAVAPPTARPQGRQPDASVCTAAADHRFESVAQVPRRALGPRGRRVAALAQLTVRVPPAAQAGAVYLAAWPRAGPPASWHARRRARRGGRAWPGATGHALAVPGGDSIARRRSTTKSCERSGRAGVMHERHSVRGLCRAHPPTPPARPGSSHSNCLPRRRSSGTQSRGDAAALGPRRPQRVAPRAPVAPRGLVALAERVANGTPIVAD